MVGAPEATHPGRATTTGHSRKSHEHPEIILPGVTEASYLSSPLEGNNMPALRVGIQYRWRRVWSCRKRHGGQIPSFHRCFLEKGVPFPVGGLGFWVQAPRLADTGSRSIFSFQPWPCASPGRNVAGTLFSSSSFWHRERVTGKTSFISPCQAARTSKKSRARGGEGWGGEER